jgi:hypothetical protein
MFKLEILTNIRIRDENHFTANGGYVLDGGVIGEIIQCGRKAKIFNSEYAVKKYVNDFKNELIKNEINEYFEYYIHRPFTKNTDFKNDRITLKEKLN